MLFMVLGFNRMIYSNKVKHHTGNLKKWKIISGKIQINYICKLVKQYEPDE